MLLYTSNASERMHRKTKKATHKSEIAAMKRNLRNFIFVLPWITTIH